MDALQQYWFVLEKIDSRYRELETSRTDLRWYQEKIKQADELSKSQQFEAISTIKLGSTGLPENVNHALMESAIEELHKHLDEFHREKKEEQRKQEEGFNKLKSLENKSRDKLQSLEARLQRLVDQIKDLEKRIISLKTARMGYICFLIGIGIVSALLTGNVIATFIITGITFTVVSLL